MWKLVVLPVLAMFAGCKGEGDGARERTDFEDDFTRKELVELDAAIAQRDLTSMVVGCTIVMSSRRAAQRPDIVERCHVVAPRIYLEDAVADVQRKLAEPLPPELACMQLFVSDAFAAIAKRPPTDPKLRALVDEFTRLCPAQAAQARARAERR